MYIVYNYIYVYTEVVEEIFKGKNIETGINIAGIKLSNLRFADNIIQFAEIEEKLKILLKDQNAEGKKG